MIDLYDRYRVKHMDEIKEVKEVMHWVKDDAHFAVMRRRHINIQLPEGKSQSYEQLVKAAVISFGIIIYINDNVNNIC